MLELRVFSASAACHFRLVFSTLCSFLDLFIDATEMSDPGLTVSPCVLPLEGFKFIYTVPGDLYIDPVSLYIDPISSVVSTEKEAHAPPN